MKRLALSCLASLLAVSSASAVTLKYTPINGGEGVYMETRGIGSSIDVNAKIEARTALVGLAKFGDTSLLAGIGFASWKYPEEGGDSKGSEVLGAVALRESLSNGVSAMIAYNSGKRLRPIAIGADFKLLAMKSARVSFGVLYSPTVTIGKSQTIDSDRYASGYFAISLFKH